MNKIILIIVFMCYSYGSFVFSVFLNKVKTIKYIKIIYKNANKSTKTKKFSLNHIFSDDIIIFSETKQENTFLRKIDLEMPTNIDLLNIHYINENNENKEKVIHIKKNNIMSNNILYLYENIDYIYSLDNLSNNNNALKTSSKNNFKFKLINVNNSLKIFYHEDDKNLYLKIQGCQVNGKCIEPTYQKDNKIIVFKFIFKNNHTQKIVNNTFSRLVKRIEVGFHSNKRKNNHLVIESKTRKIINITKISTNNKQLIYKIEFEG